MPLRTTEGPQARTDHHALAPEDVVLLLGTHARAGLVESEARERLRRTGPNQLPRTPGRSRTRRLLAQFANPLVVVLLVRASVTTVLGDLVDALVIAGVVVLDAAVGFAQEARAQNALQALARVTCAMAVVVRDGRARTVEATVLVPGDLVVLAAGDKVPADLRLVQTQDLRIDESALTGEVLPSHKQTAACAAHTTLSDRDDMAYGGTLVTAGRAHGLVVATGADTELGRVHQLMAGVVEVQTPLTRRLAALSRRLTLAVVVLAVLTFRCRPKRMPRPSTC